jgi:hypothetical protein
MLPAGKLTDAAGFTVNSAQPRPVPLTPNHAFVMGGGDLAAPLNQHAISVEEKLGVVNGSRPII